MNSGNVTAERRSKRMLEEIGPIGVADEVHDALQQGDRLCCQPFAAACEAEQVGRRRADVDALRLDAERAREAVSHLFPVAGDPWLLADQDAVRVHQHIAGVAHLRVRVSEQVERVGAVPAGVSGGEERADVAEPGRPEHARR